MVCGNAARKVDYLPGEWIYVDRVIKLYAVWSANVSYRIEYNDHIIVNAIENEIQREKENVDS